MRKKTAAFGGALILGLTSLTGAAAALPVPPDRPTTPAPVTDPNSVDLYTLEGPQRAKADGVKLRTREDSTIRTATITYAPGSASGWHAHPGLVLAVVRSGAVVRRVGCKKELFEAGDAFIEVGAHNVSNRYVNPNDPNAVDAVIEVTQIFPVGEPPRVPADAPRCRPRHGGGHGGYGGHGH